MNNYLICGNALAVLPEIKQKLFGKVKLVFLDPPYNTKNTFEYYQDSISNESWILFMRNTLEGVYDLLSDDGSIWITIGDSEFHHLRILCDEVFGSKNYVASIVWQKTASLKNKSLISNSHDYIIVFAKNIKHWIRNLLPFNNSNDTYKNLDNDSRGAWQSVIYSVQSESAERREKYRYPITLPSGRIVIPPVGRHWNGTKERTEQLMIDNRLWFGKDGDSLPRFKLFLSETKHGLVPNTWWDCKFAGSNQDAKKEILQYCKKSEPFNTPKPERLLQRILSISTNPHDLILDLFAGSGTSGVVASKMDRNWIMIELNEYVCNTIIIPRITNIGNNFIYKNLSNFEVKQ